MKKKRIMCFGDSLTWGFNPLTSQRFDDDVRWTGVLQKLLGDEYKIVEEGQNGRTIALDDPYGRDKNSTDYIWACIESQNPLDLVVIMLGTNDLKSYLKLSADDIANEMDGFLTLVKKQNYEMLGNQFKILLMCPPMVNEDIKNPDAHYGEVFGFQSARSRSEKFCELYKLLAQKHEVEFLDTNDFVYCSNADCIHLEENQQSKLAEAVAGKVIEILK